MKIAILGSGHGTNAEAILKAQHEGRLGSAQITGILSDKEHAGILKIAQQYGIEGCYMHPGPFKTKLEGEQEEAYIQKIQSWEVDLVVLAGFMRVIKPRFLESFLIINLHPSLLPAFPGLNAIKQAYDYGVKITGCTVHWVNGEVDGGKIIDQMAVRVNAEDTLETLEKKVHEAEHALMPSVIARISARWSNLVAN